MGDNKNPTIQKYIEALIISGAVKIAPHAESIFTQRNGNKTWIFVDHGDALLEPTHNHAVIDALRDYIQENMNPGPVTVLMNVASKTSPQMTGSLAYLLNLPQIITIGAELQSVEKGTNRRFRVPYNLPQAPHILMIDDILTTGKTVLETVGAIQEQPYPWLKKAEFTLLTCLARNESLAVKTLQEKGVSVHYLATLDEVIVSIWKNFSSQQQQGLLQEMPHLSTIVSR